MTFGRIPFSQPGVDYRARKSALRPAQERTPVPSMPPSTVLTRAAAARALGK